MMNLVSRHRPTDPRRRGARSFVLFIGLTAVVLAGLLSVEGSFQDHSGQVAAASPLLRLSTPSLVIEEACDSLIPETSSLAASIAPPYGHGTVHIDAHTTLAAASQPGGATSLTFPAATIAAAATSDRLMIDNLALSQDRQVDFDLQRFTVFSPNTEFVAKDAHGATALAIPDVALFRGHLTDDPASTVFLGLSPAAINGFVTTHGATYSISSARPGTYRDGAELQCMIANLETLPLSRFSCGADEFNPPLINESSLAAAAVVEPQEGLRVCEMAVVGDFEFFNELHHNLTAATVYVAQLFAAVSTIYERDLHVALVVKYVEIWTDSDDPFTLCGTDGLEEFRLYGDSYLRDHSWNLAFKLSGCGAGGRGYYTAMCFKGAERGATPYATGRVQGSFPSPLEPNEGNLDIVVVAHEIGHNFSSPHTHCYVPPIDRCYNKEIGCYEGDTVCSRGTIMSYCFYCPNGMANIDLNFHPRVIQQIAPVIQGSCLALGAKEFVVYSDATETLTVDSIRTTVPWLHPGRDAFRIDPADSIIVPIQVSWDDARANENTAQVLIYSSDGATASPLVMDITAIRHRPRADFASSQTSGCWPLTVTFTDFSTNHPESWLWRFGDNDSSSEGNPVHTYMRKGDYKVTLAVSNGCGTHIAPKPLTVHVTEPAVCCSTSTFIVTKNQPVLQAMDIWACNAEQDLAPQDNTYSISENSFPSCGATIAANRYLNIFPSYNWYGRSDITISATTPDGCRCNSLARIIVNDPPTIELSTPPVGMQVTNRPYNILWRDSDGDNNALIRLYYARSDDCSTGTEIPTGGILEDNLGAQGEFLWNIFGVPDGIYRIRAVITDPYAGNEDCSPGTVLLDQTPPTTSVEFTCLDEEQDGWCHGDVDVQLSATDNLTGVQGIFYSLNRGPWQLYTGTVRIERVGKTMIEYYAIDSTGNVEPTRTAPTLVQIDRSAPRVERIYSDNPNFRSGDYTTKSPSFSILISDDGVGVDPTSIAIDLTPGGADGTLHYTAGDTNVTYNPVSRRISLNTTTPLRQGAQHLMISLADELGNATTASTDFIVGSGMAILDVVNFPNPFKQDTHFTFTLTENPREVRIRIFDLSGELMRELVTADVHEGFNEVPWDGLSDGGVTLANGAYLYEIIATGDGGTARHQDKLAILR